MPVRNGEAFVAEAVRSIIAQSFRDWELVVLDDGSTDRTPAILAGLQTRDPRIRCIRHAPAGLVAVLNDGIAHCRAELVARMDADDVARPERLALQVAAMMRRPDLIALGGSICYLDPAGVRGRAVRYPVGAAVAAHLAVGSPLAHPTALFRRQRIVDLGGYRPWFRHCEDYDLWLRCHEAGDIDNLTDIVLDYRVHPGSTSVRNAEEQTLRTFVAWGCHLIRCRGGGDPLASLPDDPVTALEALALTPDERHNLLWSLIGQSAHLLGDRRACAIYGRWLDALGPPRNQHACRMLAIHHLRAIRYYRNRRDMAGAARNAWHACARTPLQAAAHLLGFLRGRATL